ncbi:MAG: DegV family protein [Lachnospiraceae bacterium]|jgi:DegV family protein with EDD domain|nr:DegV family protein [Lachnospiraceae bacterium]
MAKVAIVTDSNSGITQEEAAKLGVSVVPMPFMFDDDEEVFYEGINLSRKQFFEKLETAGRVMTSQPAPTEILKVWDGLLNDGGYDEIVYIPMSSGLSGSCQSAMMLSSNYDDGKVQVVNNQRISVTQKRSVLDALELAAAGNSAEEIHVRLEKAKFDSSIYIMPETLKYLKKGGRITPAAAAIGSLLHIRPVLQIRGERLDAFAKARTDAQGRMMMITAMRNDIDKKFGGVAAKDVWLYAVHSNVPDKEREWAQQVRDAFPDYQVEEDCLSLSVCCHIGPDALAIACSRKMKNA